MDGIQSETIYLKYLETRSDMDNRMGRASIKLSFVAEHIRIRDLQRRENE